MAKVSIMYWKEIPAQVKAEDDDREISMSLPDRFQKGIDEISMFDGSFGADDYLESWEWGPETEVEEPAEKAAEATVQRIESRFPEDFVERIRALHGAKKRDPKPGAVDHWMDETQ